MLHCTSYLWLNSPFDATLTGPIFDAWPGRQKVAIRITVGWTGGGWPGGLNLVQATGCSATAHFVRGGIMNPTSPLKNALVAFFNVAKCEARLAAS